MLDSNIYDADLSWIIQHIRPEDLAEMTEECKTPPLEKLRTAVNSSMFAGLVREINGNPIAVYGMLAHSDTVGIPWMICAKDVVRHKADILVASRDMVKYMKSVRPALFNRMLTRNKMARRFVEHLGFTTAENGIWTEFLYVSPEMRQ